MESFILVDGTSILPEKVKKKDLGYKLFRTVIYIKECSKTVKEMDTELSLTLHKQTNKKILFTMVFGMKD